MSCRLPTVDSGIDSAIGASQVLRISAASFGFVYGGVKLGYLKASSLFEQLYHALAAEALYMLVLNT